MPEQRQKQSALVTWRGGRDEFHPGSPGSLLGGEGFLADLGSGHVLNEIR